MNRLRLFLVGSLLFLLIPSAGAVALGQSVSNDLKSGVQEQSEPAVLVSGYMQAISSQAFDIAYGLLTTSFKTKIPLVAFANQLKTSHFAEDIQSFQVGRVLIQENSAEIDCSVVLEASGTGSLYTGTGTFHLLEELTGWKIDLPWEDFLSSKLATQQPLSACNSEGIEARIQYVLSYVGDGNTQGFTRVRLDLNNKSGQTIRWQLPSSNTESCFIVEPASGRRFYLIPGCGITAPKNGGFDLESSDGVFILTCQPESVGSLFLSFQRVPDDLQKFSMSVSGIAIAGPSADWRLGFDNVPFVAEIAPSN